LFVSLHLSPQSRSPADDLERVDEVVEQVLLADRAGIASVSLTEHHLAGFNTYCDPMAFAMYLAGKVEQTYLALHVIQAPLQHPVRLAEQCNMLDLLTRGRCMIALAPGSFRQIELDAFGVSVDARASMTAQGIDSMLRAWSWQEGDGPLDVSNDYYSGVIAGRVSPTSFRRPHPLIGRATATLATVADTGRRGLPVILGTDPDASVIRLYRESIASAGHDPRVVAECDDWLSFVDMVSLAETETKADAILMEFVEGGGSGPIVTDPAEGSAVWAAEWRARQQARKRWSRPVTPAMLVDRLLAFKQTGVNHARVTLAEVPGQHQRNLDMLHLFLEEVLPQLDPQQLPGPAMTIRSGPGLTLSETGQAVG
jgi:alkanesulfonate monooxygenase SsuD/methylene tetrahydromethanopterin reductase-like flavin-dependent oxidoreductase (luciferase family)